MKRKGLKILAFLMAMNILFSSAGFAMYEHTCHSLGIISHSLDGESFCPVSLEEDSEKHDDELSFKQGACCETAISHEKLKTEADLNGKLHLKKVGLTGLPKANAFVLEKTSLAYFTEDLSLPPSNAPPLYGRALLSKIQVFII